MGAINRRQISRPCSVYQTHTILYKRKSKKTIDKFGIYSISIQSHDYRTVRSAFAWIIICRSCYDGSFSQTQHPKSQHVTSILMNVFLSYGRYRFHEASLAFINKHQVLYLYFWKIKIKYIHIYNFHSRSEMGLEMSLWNTTFPMSHSLVKTFHATNYSTLFDFFGFDDLQLSRSDRCINLC